MILKDKIAVVTGASRGIGRSIVEVFAREGASVVMVLLLAGDRSSYVTGQTLVVDGGYLLSSM